MSLYRFFAKALKRSDLSDSSGPLLASITISDASFTVYRTKVRALPAAHARNLPQQAYEFKNTKIYSKGVLADHTKISTNKNFPLYGNAGGVPGCVHEQKAHGG